MRTLYGFDAIIYIARRVICAVRDHRWRGAACGDRRRPLVRVTLALDTSHMHRTLRECAEALRSKGFRVTSDYRKPSDQPTSRHHQAPSQHFATLPTGRDGAPPRNGGKRP